ncbi:MAG: endonuclease MutS2 [Dehalogenimonas sp.]|uniref:Endonuclease MutS2 n=1 Tax=Candidatus Dehalogenimonas loeffleri TaxID=3127115 RepID=A0ABZ2J2N6_9CHLR|nr:endonuclease MutS2 [Dehalogenimonas sp.]
MQDKDLSLLEFPRIREIIAEFCHFELSRALVLKLLPSTDVDWIEARLAESAEARRILQHEPGLSAYGLSDVTEPLRFAHLGRGLEGKVLAEIRRNIGVLRQLKSGIGDTSADTPRLAAIAENIAGFSTLEKTMDRIITADGELQPGASPELLNIRNRLRAKRDEMTAKLQNLIQSEATRHYIQEPIITEREGRFSLAVKAEYKGEIKGIVHDISNSGATVFLEPFTALETGNEFKELEIMEAREIERILRELSAAVGNHAAAIISGLRAAAEIDYALAKARYAHQVKALEAAVYSNSSSEKGIIHLNNARHPLIGDSAIPLSIEIGKDFSIIVITGPNTGGKTVALKTLGLLSAMTQAGLPIPAESGSRLPVFSGIFADIGDEQSVQEALSTFSGHMNNIARIINLAKDGSLILLDELGASTDPQEGSALARAILLHLQVLGALGAVTSHFTDLKVFAHVTQGLQNASFEFDPDTLKPTYRLTLGSPGGSNAIATAARYGIPPTIIETARGLLSGGGRRLEELLNVLQEEKQRLEDQQKLISRERISLHNRQQILQTELSRLHDEKTGIIQTARDTIVEEISQLQKELRLARNTLEKERSTAALNQAKTISENVRTRLKQGIFSEISNEVAPDNELLKTGDRVWLKEAEIEADVVSVNDKTGQIEVSAGSLRFKLERQGVVKTNGISGKRPDTKVRILSAGKQIGIELDLRGKRADDIETLLDEYLNNAATANLPEVRVIHGYGTGVLRDIVRQQAARHPLVGNFFSAPRDQGGDGATVIRLK